MRSGQTIILLILIIISSAFRCKKESGICAGLLQPQADFALKEILTDTAFFADTVYGDNPVMFSALRSYKAVLWKVGDDPRDFTNNSFALPFYLFRGTIDVQFTGKNDPNPFCFPGDSGVYRGVKQLTIVEQVDRATLTRSPLVGHYKGSFNTSPNDSFIIRIDYFDSTKYDPSITGGAKNFYWISNIPKGFIDSTGEAARQYPELRNGMMPEMGYKCLSFGDYSNPNKGKGHAELIGNLLKVYYSGNVDGNKVFTGKRVP